MVLLPSSSKKLAAECQEPYAISRRTDPVNYEVDMKGKWKRYRVLHVNMLMAWHSPAGKNTMDVLEAIVQDEEDLPEIPTSDRGPTHIIADEYLSAKQRSKLKNILDRYSAVFSNLPGHTSVVEHRPDTGSARQVKQKPYRTPGLIRE